MGFKQIFQYVVASLFTLATIWVMLFKTELLTNQWLAMVIIAIVAVTLSWIFPEGKNILKWLLKKVH